MPRGSGVGLRLRWLSFFEDLLPLTIKGCSFIAIRPVHSPPSVLQKRPGMSAFFSKPGVY